MFSTLLLVILPISITSNCNITEDKASQRIQLDNCYEARRCTFSDLYDTVGGAIRMESAASYVFVQDCYFISCTAMFGGALYLLTKNNMIETSRGIMCGARTGQFLELTLLSAPKGNCSLFLSTCVSCAWDITSERLAAPCYLSGHLTVAPEFLNLTN
jgi:hypothetical protein